MRREYAIEDADCLGEDLLQPLKWSMQLAQEKGAPPGLHPFQSIYLVLSSTREHSKMSLRLGTTANQYSLPSHVAAVQAFQSNIPCLVPKEDFHL